MSGGRAHRGSTSYMRPHEGFLGALDIVNVVPLRIRIDEVFIYEPGSRPMGRPLKDVMTTIGHSVPGWTMVGGEKEHSNKYSKGPKEWILNGGIQAVLIYRFGFDTSDWIDKEVDLFIDPCRSPKGGQTYGIRVLPIEGEMDEDEMHRRLLAHLPFKPPQPRQEDEPDEPAAERQDPYKAAASWAE